MNFKAGALAIAAMGILSAQTAQTLPDDYIARGTAIAPGLAPGMKVQEFGGTPRRFEVRFVKGDEVMSGLTDFAAKYHIKTAEISGVGAFGSGMFGWTDPEKRAMKKVPLNQEAEVVSFIGNVSTQNGKPNVHVHASVAYSDGTVHGGHLVEGHVGLIMELFVTELENQ